MESYKMAELRFMELKKKSYYVLSTDDYLLGIRDNELGECLLAWSKIHNAEMYLNEILPLSEIQTKFYISQVAYGDLVIEAMESNIGIIIDELPDDNWLEFTDTVGWKAKYPLDINKIKAYINDNYCIVSDIELESIPF
jgi:hypothetical protein